MSKSQTPLHSPGQVAAVADGAAVIEALATCRSEVRNLKQWLRLVECSQCEFEIDPHELAEMVGQRLHVLLQLIDLHQECCGVKPKEVTS